MVSSMDQSRVRASREEQEQKQHLQTAGRLIQENRFKKAIKSLKRAIIECECNEVLAARASRNHVDYGDVTLPTCSCRMTKLMDATFRGTPQDILMSLTSRCHCSLVIRQCNNRLHVTALDLLTNVYARLGLVEEARDTAAMNIIVSPTFARAYTQLAQMSGLESQSSLVKQSKSPSRVAKGSQRYAIYKHAHRMMQYILDWPDRSRASRGRAQTAEMRAEQSMMGFLQSKCIDLDRDKVRAHMTTWRELMMQDFVAYLPTEISQIILSYLTLPDLVTCLSVSSQWKSSVYAPSLWRTLDLDQIWAGLESTSESKPTFESLAKYYAKGQVSALRVREMKAHRISVEVLENFLKQTPHLERLSLGGSPYLSRKRKAISQTPGVLSRLACLGFLDLILNRPPRKLKYLTLENMTLELLSDAGAQARANLLPASLKELNISNTVWNPDALDLLFNDEHISSWDKLERLNIATPRLSPQQPARLNLFRLSRLNRMPHLKHLRLERVMISERYNDATPWTGTQLETLVVKDVRYDGQLPHLAQSLRILDIDGPPGIIISQSPLQHWPALEYFRGNCRIHHHPTHPNSATLTQARVDDLVQTLAPSIESHSLRALHLDLDGWTNKALWLALEGTLCNDDLVELGLGGLIAADQDWITGWFATFENLETVALFPTDCTWGGMLRRILAPDRLCKTKKLKTVYVSNATAAEQVELEQHREYAGRLGIKVVGVRDGRAPSPWQFTVI